MRMKEETVPSNVSKHIIFIFLIIPKASLNIKEIIYAANKKVTITY